MKDSRLRKSLALVMVLALCLGLVPAFAEGFYEEALYGEPAFEEFVYEAPIFEEAPVEEAAPALPEEGGPVAVSFLPEPAEAQITVYDPALTGEFGELLPLQPDEYGTYWLLPGEYLVDVVCEGYESFLAVPLTVETEALALPVVMTPVEAEETAAEPDGEELIVEELIVEEPVAEEPIVEEPVVGEPVLEEAAEELPAEALIVEELVLEEKPAVEAPAQEEPAVEMELAANAASVSITTQPASKTVAAGGTATFTVKASGSNLTYQWQYKSGTTWKNVAASGSCKGATTATLSVPAKGHENMEFRCVVKGSGGTATSKAAKLTVKASTTVAKPSITKHPATTTVAAGGTGSFTVKASGSGLTYQWQYKSGTAWKNVAASGSCKGATTATLTVPAKGHENMEFRCAVKNSGGTVYSNSAILKVKSSTTVTKPSITQQPANAEVAPDGTASFTVKASGSSLSYQWQYKSGSTWKNVALSGSCKGAATATLTVPAKGHENMEFKCVVKNSAATVISNPAKLTVKVTVTAPSITQQPENATVPENGTATFTVKASGTNLSYQWQYKSGANWKNITGGSCTGYKTDTLSVPAAGHNNMEFKCVVTNSAGTKESQPAKLTVLPGAPTITQHPANAKVGADETATFTVAASGENLSFQWQRKSGEDWVDLTESDGCTGINTPSLQVPAEGNADVEFRCKVSNSTGDSFSNPATLLVKPKITQNPADSIVNAGGTGTFTVEASGTKLSYQWQYKSGETWKNVSATGSCTGTTTATLLVPSAGRANMQFRCAVTNDAGTEYSEPATLLVLAKITKQPVNVTVTPGATASFTVTASSTGSFTYQWQRKSGEDWVDLTESDGCTGITSATLTVPAEGHADLQFRCAVTNNAGTVYSDPATLTVDALFTLNDVVYEGINATTARVLQYNGTAASLEIPEIVNGSWTVVEIGSEAFMNNTSLQSIDLPDTVALIASRAFAGCTSLSSMN